jgi:hypothetical protein
VFDGAVVWLVTSCTPFPGGMGANYAAMGFHCRSEIRWVLSLFEVGEPDLSLNSLAVLEISRRVKPARIPGIGKG